MSQPTLKSTYAKSTRVAFTLGSGVTSLLPTPNIVVSGSTTGAGVSQVVDSTKDFTARGVKVGDLVMNLSNGQITLISAVGTTTLNVADSYFNAGNIAYAVYSQSDIATVTPYVGAVLYNCLGAATGNITVTTLDGYSLNVVIPAGGICPIQVSAVTAVAGVTWGQLIALW